MNNKAQEVFYKYYISVIRKNYAYLKDKLQDLSNEDFEDIIQDSYITLVENIKRGAGIKEEMNDNYLRTLILNTVIFKYKDFISGNGEYSYKKLPTSKWIYTHRY